VWPVRVRLTLDGAFSSDSALALNIYRVIHEALINAARHSGASIVDVVLTCAGASVVARIADDGRGFPFVGTRSLAELDATHQGPVTLRERIGRLDGDLVIDSTPTGSTLHIIIPLLPTPG
jgi:signal transduction histidine kinase